MSRNRLFGSKSVKSILGLASPSLFSPTIFTTSIGPVAHQFRNNVPSFRELHFKTIFQETVPSTFVAIGGGISALAYIETFIKKYHATHRRYPNIVMITDEKNHWLHKIDMTYENRPWGQSIKALIKPLQGIFKDIYPDMSGEDYPTLKQMQIVRGIYFLSVQRKYGLQLIDEHVESITQAIDSKGIIFKLQNGKLYTELSNDPNAKIFNFATQSRRPGNALLSIVGQEGGLFYSQPKTKDPACISGGGLTAMWATHDTQGPLAIIRKQLYPLRFYIPPERTNVTELIEEQTRIELLKGGEFLVEGVDFRSGKVVRMRIPNERCYLSSGATFNYQLTEGIDKENAIDIDPFGHPGRLAGMSAARSVNPEGSIAHRFSVFSVLLGRYPVEDVLNIARYTNLWREYVEMECTKHFIRIDSEFLDKATVALGELFQKKAVPSADEYESILREIYEKVPPEHRKTEWSIVRDIVLPLTTEIDHIFHPVAAPPQLFKPW